MHSKSCESSQSGATLSQNLAAPLYWLLHCSKLSFHFADSHGSQNILGTIQLVGQEIILFSCVGSIALSLLANSRTQIVDHLNPGVWLVVYYTKIKGLCSRVALTVMFITVKKHRQGS